MNKRTVLEILPQSVTDLFNEWQLRILALLSLSSQIALLLLGNRRKYKAEKWLRSILWLAYSPEDLIVAVFVGILSECQGNGENPSQQLQAFWMPFLLLHLGGPDTITAYSLEDIELWTRQFLQRLLQFGWAASKIFFTSWKGKLLNFLAVPLFGAGLIKSVEKTWFLKSGSNYHLRKSAIIARLSKGGPTVDAGGSKPDDGESNDGGIKPDAGVSKPDDHVVDCTCRCPGHICTDVVLEWNRPSFPDMMLVWNRPNYAAFARGCDFNGHCSCRPASKECEIVNLPSSPQPESENFEEVIMPSPPSRNKTIPDADLLEKAVQFFPKFKGLFADLVLDWTDLEQSKSFFESISSAEAFQVVEIELGFMYDVFYTKPVAVYDEFSFLRFINLLVSISALLGFWIIDKHEFRYVDLIITWLLLVEAILQEIYCIILMFSSERTENWLNKQEKTGMTRIYQAISSCRVPFLFPDKKRWSDSMGQCSLLSNSLENLHIVVWNFCCISPLLEMLSEVWNFCISLMSEMLSEIWNFFSICLEFEDCSKNSSVVPKFLKILIFEQLQEKSRTASNNKKAKKFSAHKGELALENMKCFIEFGWSLGEEFDENILLWHVATELCYYADLNRNSSISVENSNCKASKLVSDYMLHLLLKRPRMLPNGIGEIRFQKTCDEATEFFLSGNIKDKIQACEKLLQVNTKNRQPKEKEEKNCMSVLFNACLLAQSLQLLEKAMEWNCEKKWEMMSDVWIEMLSYAASQCPSNQHAEALRRGGELLTHVWLLMAHFGLTEHSQAPRTCSRVSLL